MSKITKPDISIQWAQAGVIVTPSDTKKQTGWVVEKPAYDYMNWLQNRQDTAIAYTYQMGIPEWDSATGINMLLDMQHTFSTTGLCIRHYKSAPIRIQHLKHPTGLGLLIVMVVLQL